MSFNSLKKDELVKVADFFVIEVGAADPEKGPTKKELLAALASGDEPVTWEQYNEIYLEANPVDTTPPPAAKVEPVEESEPVEKVLVRYTGNLGTLELVGYTFTQKHPFAPVPQDVAEHLVLKHEGFRLALPKEITDYYN